MQLIWGNILCTAAEECGKTVIVVIKYDSKENLNYPDHPLLNLNCANIPEYI